MFTLMFLRSELNILGLFVALPAIAFGVFLWILEPSHRNMDEAAWIGIAAAFGDIFVGWFLYRFVTNRSKFKKPRSFEEFEAWKYEVDKRRFEEGFGALFKEYNGGTPVIPIPAHKDHRFNHVFICVLREYVAKVFMPSLHPIQTSVDKVLPICDPENPIRLEAITDIIGQPEYRVSADTLMQLSSDDFWQFDRDAYSDLPFSLLKIDESRPSELWIWHPSTHNHDDTIAAKYMNGNLFFEKELRHFAGYSGIWVLRDAEGTPYINPSKFHGSMPPGLNRFVFWEQRRQHEEAQPDVSEPIL